jgi:hypothetical protein
MTLKMAKMYSHVVADTWTYYPKASHPFPLTLKKKQNNHILTVRDGHLTQRHKEAKEPFPVRVGQTC